MVGNGKRTRFWLDIWVGKITLKVAFPSLFWAAEIPEASVAANYDLPTHSWDIKFKRTFGEQDMILWEEMIQNIFLSDEQDRVKWALEKPRRLLPMKGMTHTRWIIA